MRKTDKCTAVDRRRLDAALGRNLPKIAIVFAFPGLGVGETYNNLPGCTLETYLMQDVAKIFEMLGIGFFGVSSGPVPVSSDCITYIHTNVPASPFPSISAEGCVFYERATFALNGSDCISIAIGDGVEQHVLAIKKWASSVIAEQLAMRATGVENLNPGLETARRLTCGVDSDIILEIGSLPETILKVGPARVLDNEIAVLETTEAVAALFPQVHGHGTFGERRWVLLAAANPEPVHNVVFDNVAAAQLRADWCTHIKELLQPLRALYANSLTLHQCANSAYHYTRRIEKLIQRPDFSATFDKLANFSADLSVLLGAPLVINGEQLPSFIELNASVCQQMEMTPVEAVALIHGDLHLSNILRTKTDSGYVFIDPRAAWDEEPIDKIGYGDPLYDFATMLHSVGATATVLARLSNGSSNSLAHATYNGESISIELDPALHHNLVHVQMMFPELVSDFVPAPCLGTDWKARLHVGAAGAFLGWLKYSDSVQTSGAWWSFFAAAALSLSMAQRTHEG